MSRGLPNEAVASGGKLSGVFPKLLGRRSKRELALRESELIAYLNWWQ